MPDTVFEKTIHISRPECDASNRLSLSNVMRNLQAIAGEHLDALGLTQERLGNEGFVYLLNRVHLHIERRPLATETLVIRTKPRGAKGAISHRDVYYCDAENHVQIFAQSAWVLADPHTHHVRRPTDLGHTIQIEPGEYDFNWCKQRLTRPDQVAVVAEDTIRYSQIDSNQHLNNAIYSDLVVDYLPLELVRDGILRDYTIHFAGEIRLGERMTIYRAELGSGNWYVGADRPDGSRCFDAILKFDE